MRQRLCVLSLLCACALAADALPQQVRSLDQGPISVATDRLLVEPHIAVDPNDSRRIAVAAIAVDPDPSRDWAERLGCVAAISSDGGATWETSELPDTRCADPWLAFSPAGTPYLTLLGRSAGRPSALALYRLEAGSWRPVPHGLTGFVDRPTIAWLDSGALAIGAVGMHRERMTGVTAVLDGDGGTVLPVRHVDQPGYRLSVSNLAARGSSAVVVLKAFASTEPLRSLDRPTSRLLERETGSHDRDRLVPINGSCANRSGFTALAVDRSTGPHAGRRYAACVGAEPAGLLLFRAAPDADQPLAATRIPTGPFPGRVWASGVAIGPEGELGLTWIAATDRGCRRPWFIASIDGGATFTAPIPLGPGPICDAGVDRQVVTTWPAGTHYGAISAAGAGAFVVAWSAPVDERPRVHLSRVRVVR